MTIISENPTTGSNWRERFGASWICIWTVLVSFPLSHDHLKAGEMVMGQNSQTPNTYDFPESLGKTAKTYDLFHIFLQI